MTPEVVKMLAVGMIGGLGLLGPALALGLIGYSALTGLARNPEARGPIFTNMILIAGLAEAIGIYAFVTAIMVMIL
ncbi:MAG: ATP synthase F0 subunit C [Chloroflexota bacterium]